MTTTRYFLYFIPGLKNGPGFEAEARKIIGSSIEGCALMPKNISRGPGSSDGVLFSAIPKLIKANDADVVRSLEYCADPARQAWFEGDGFWVGANVDAMPGPGDLERQSMTGGYYHTGPAGTWLVPLARRFDGGTALDERLTYSPSGDVSFSPLPRYEKLCAFAAENFELLSRLSVDVNGDVSVSFDRRYVDVAVEALSVNYHVGRYELSLLGALTRDSAANICGLLCDGPMIVQALSQKKTSSAEELLDTDSGGQED